MKFKMKLVPCHYKEYVLPERRDVVLQHVKDLLDGLTGACHRLNIGFMLEMDIKISYNIPQKTNIHLVRQDE